MPRASTLIFILSALVLYVIGLTTPATAALFLAMALELAIWKRASDKLRGAQLVRVQARRPRDFRGRR